MQRRYLGGIVRAERQTEKAFLCSFDWSDSHGYKAVNRWIPLSVIDEEAHDMIEAACDGDLIEIHIAEWWLRANL